MILYTIVEVHEITNFCQPHSGWSLSIPAQKVLGFTLGNDEIQGIEIVIIHKGEQPSFEEELTYDVLEIITVFSTRLYGIRSKKHKKMLEALQDATGPQN